MTTIKIVNEKIRGRNLLDLLKAKMENPDRFFRVRLIMKPAEERKKANEIEKTGIEDDNIDEDDSQTERLKQYGCEAIFTGKKEGLDKFRQGDTLVVSSVSVLGESLQDIISAVNDFDKKGIKLKSIEEKIVDTTGDSGKTVSDIFAALAKFTEKNKTETNGKKTGVYGKPIGRKPVTGDNFKVIKAKKMYKEEGLRVAEICGTLKISRATLYRYLKK